MKTREKVKGGKNNNLLIICIISKHLFNEVAYTYNMYYKWI